MKKVYFVRHGETEANRLHYEPTPKEPLNATGFMQADAVAKRVNNIDFEKLFSSSYTRAQQTAAAIAKEKSLNIQTEEAFREMTPPSSLFGKEESSELVQQFRKIRNEHVEDPTWHQEDGDSFADIFIQINKAKKILLEDSAESILVTSHTFFIQLFAAAILLGLEKPTYKWLDLAKRLTMSNTGVTLFETDDLGWKLLLWNDHAHFAE